VHRERAEVDALAIGSETLLVDDPQLTARGVYRDRPLTRVVFDRRLRMSTSARLLSTLDEGPVVVMTLGSDDPQRRANVDALVNAGAQVESIDPIDDEPRAVSTAFLRAALGRLASRELTSMVVDGGPSLHEAFWHAGVVDRIELFIAPKPIGVGGVPWAAVPDGTIGSLAELTAVPLGEDVRIEGYVDHVYGTR
jgi:diaminohydroxyphosphoribosylaminopyrimidine deaminase/5-amino-6-(5-phosphoribosylamino)uracil reductase